MQKINIENKIPTPVFSDSPQKRRYQSTGQILGNGNFGTVFKGIDNQTESPLAIKTIVLREECSREEAKTEEAALKSLKGTHAIGYRAAFEGSPKTGPAMQQYVIVMDMANGQNLEEIEDISIDEIASIFKQLLEFLDSLEKRKLVHYDLKPANVIWDRASRKLTVVDFGATRVMNGTYSDGPITTPEYEAPEQILSMQLDPYGELLSLVNHEYDLWSVGCIIYFLLTGDDLITTMSRDLLSVQDLEHYKMQQIVEQIGPPTADYLSRCSDGYLFFNKNLALAKIFDIPEGLHWKEMIANKCDEHNTGDQFKMDLIELLSRMLRYENRGKPIDLLQNPIFSKEITAHFSFDRQKPCKMYLHRASELQKPIDELTPADIPNSDLTINLRTYKHCTLHIPFDQKYVLFLESEGGLIREFITLNEGQSLDISQLQAQLESPVRKTRKTLFDQFNTSSEPQKKLK